MRTQIVLQKSSEGFTLVETLVAITVLLLVVVGPMTVAQKGIQNAYYANEQVTAVFLAQEAIEALRELRDNDGLNAYDNGIGAETWDWYEADIHSDCKDSNGCAYDDGGFYSCLSRNNCVLKENSGTSEYSYDSGEPNSLFTRKVYVEDTLTGGVLVTVGVTWNAKIFGNSPRTVRLQTWIYDHYERFEN